ncbi:MAG: gliding motility-associated C-terminal domain-containing protein [Bacteroidota bacterium]
MKNLLHLIASLATSVLLLFFVSNANAQAPGCPFVEAGPNTTVPCNGSTTINASFLPTGATTTYSVGSIPYAPPYPMNAGTAIMVGSDDVWSAVIPLPFNFCYFGTSYNQIVVGANGCISFNTAYASGSCPWSFSASCPSSSIPINTIYGPYHDIDPSVGGSIYQAVLGTYPCRTFVVNYYNVPMYSSSCNSMLATHQIVLYEGTNAIEVYIQSAPLCSSWNSGNKMIGIQNSTGTVGFTPPGRNTGAWSTSNEAWRFMPNGAPNYVFGWYQGGVLISTSPSLSVTPAGTTAYEAQIVYTNCDGSTYTDRDTVVVSTSSTPTIGISPSATSVCGGQPVTLTASGGVSYTWSSGGTGNPITVYPIANTTYTVTGTDALGCQGTSSVVINMNAGTPITVNSPAICSGQTATLTANGGVSYQWSGGLGTSNPLTVSPGSTTTYTVTGTDGSGCVGSTSAVVTVNPNPTITVNSPSICPGQSATLTASGGDTWQWSGGLGTTNPLVVSPATTTTYTVTGTSSAGCSSTSIAVVTMNASPTISVNNSSICSGQTATLTASGGISYAWSGGLSGNPAATSPGISTTYTVTGTSALGCTGTAQAIVTVNPTPTVTVNAPAICSGQAATLTASGATTYQWNTGSSSNPITVMPGSTTTYTVTGTSLGCTGTATTVVTVNSSPIVTVNNAAICPGETATLTPGGASSYVWTGGLSGNPATASPASTTTYTVTGTNSNGCTGTALSIVTVNPTPNVTVNSPSICPGATATLTASGANTYAWSSGLSGNPATASPATTTTYTVTGTSSAGCIGTGTTVVTVQPNPTITVNNATVCLGEVATLTAAGATTYAWSGGLNGNPATTSPNNTITYTVTGTDGNGCTNTANAVVTVNPLPVVTTGLNQTICLGESTSLSVNGTNLVAYLWSPTTGLSSPTAPDPIATPLATTTYTVTATNNFGCSNTGSTIVNVSSVTASFFGGPANLDEPLIITFADQSSANAINWQWDFGNGTYSNLQNPVVTYSQAGPYIVMLIVTNAENCVDTIIQEIIVKPKFEITIPNVFTPNADGYNDVFGPKMVGFETFHMLIFNRWGRLLFETGSYSDLWDGGTNSGKEAPDGVYYFIMEIVINSNRTISEKGNVTLIR